MKTKFKIGDEVIYRGENTVIVDINVDSGFLCEFIVKFSDGWDPQNRGGNDRGFNISLLNKKEKYHYCNEDELKLINKSIVDYSYLIPFLNKLNIH